MGRAHFTAVAARDALGGVQLRIHFLSTARSEPRKQTLRQAQSNRAQIQLRIDCQEVRQLNAADEASAERARRKARLKSLIPPLLPRATEKLRRPRTKRSSNDEAA